MKLLYLFGAALLVQAERCCDVKCYKSLEYDDTHNKGNAKADCRSYQRKIITVTPCAATTVTTSTVTVTASAKGESRKSPRDFARVEPREEITILQRNNDCAASTSYPSPLPTYATSACKPSDYAKACSCLLGSTQRTTTVQATSKTVTSTKTYTTTIAASSIVTSSSRRTSAMPFPTTGSSTSSSPVSSSTASRSTSSATRFSTTSSTTTSATTCAADYCFSSALINTSIAPLISSFCEDYVSVFPSSTSSRVTITTTTTVTSTPAAVTPAPTSLTVLSTSTVTDSTLCSTTTTATITFSSISTFPTSVYYVSRKAGPGRLRLRAAKRPQILAQLTRGCEPDTIDQQLSSACSCFLQPATGTSTVTVTATASTTLAASTAAVSTFFVTQVVPTNATVCGSSTSTITETATVTAQGATSGGLLTCGVPFNPASVSSAVTGTKTCSPVPTPSLNGVFRIEGLQSGEGTIFEDCVLSGPRNITTPSGGTHSCDGTNNGANPFPGTTPTDQIDAAGRLNGFDFDGTYSNSFNDFFITRISQTSQSSTQFWGVLINLVFTPNGGCQSEVKPRDRSQWIFDAFNVNGFLSLAPDYAQVPSGVQSVTVTVSSYGTNGGNPQPAPGASIEQGGTADSNGNVVIPVPNTPGCYQYKALQSGYAPSNAFYLAVI